MGYEPRGRERDHSMSERIFLEPKLQQFVFVSCGSKTYYGGDMWNDRLKWDLCFIDSFDWLVYWNKLCWSHNHITYKHAKYPIYWCFFSQISSPSPLNRTWLIKLALIVCLVWVVSRQSDQNSSWSSPVSSGFISQYQLVNLGWVEIGHDANCAEWLRLVPRSELKPIVR